MTNQRYFFVSGHALEFALKTSVSQGPERAMLAMRDRPIVATRFMTDTSEKEAHGQAGQARRGEYAEERAIGREQPR